MNYFQQSNVLDIKQCGELLRLALLQNQHASKWTNAEYAKSTYNNKSRRTNLPSQTLLNNYKLIWFSSDHPENCYLNVKNCQKLAFFLNAKNGLFFNKIYLLFSERLNLNMFKNGKFCMHNLDCLVMLDISIFLTFECLE